MSNQGRELLSSDARRWLLAWARQCIARHLAGQANETPDDLHPECETPGGCFVSLHTNDGRLRGCIGTFSSAEPLWQNARDMAVAAASRDPRFPELRAAELQNCSIEISVLSPLRPAAPEEIEVGRHGICVQQGSRRGVLLPQVAVQYSWDREGFLDHTCKKAGLPADAWRDGSAQIEIFSANVFSEEEMTG